MTGNAPVARFPCPAYLLDDVITTGKREPVLLVAIVNRRSIVRTSLKRRM